MPAMDGYTATAELGRMDSPLRHIPIIGLTASAYAEDRRRCLQAGMDDYLAKPFDIDKLAATIIRWIDR